jgi:2-polyprenyl-3-methyl-5-hydroxy-6-metoxy-1,4-benzoquinol methylase
VFRQLEKINERPEPFQFYTAADLWTDEHTSEKMLEFHLNEEVDISSRKISFIDRSVGWIASHFMIEDGKKVADFGCGPGLYANRLAKRKAEVTGIDFSKRSIRYAQEVADREGLSVNYENRNYLDFHTQERFHLILMIMCDFCALSPDQRKKILSKFYSLLEPGGFVLLDVYSMTAFDEREETALYGVNFLNGFWSTSKYYGFLNTFKYESEKVILDKHTIIEPKGSRTIYNWLQYFTPEALEKEARECGLAVEEYYSDVAGTPFMPDCMEFAVVLKKS